MLTPLYAKFYSIMIDDAKHWLGAYHSPSWVAFYAKKWLKYLGFVLGPAVDAARRQLESFDKTKTGVKDVGPAAGPA